MDHREYRDALLSRIIPRHNDEFVPVGSESAEHTLEHLAASAEPPRVALVDIELPGADGFLLKTSSLTYVIESVRLVLNGGLALDH